jgi:hypothetical protein
MSKIDEYRKSENIADRIARDVTAALGKDRSDNDKHHIGIRFTRIDNEQWTPMLFRVYARHGYYGNSSGYSDTSTELGQFLAVAIEEVLPACFERAAELAKEAAETARVAASSEAEEVLREVSDEPRREAKKEMGRCHAGREGSGKS